MRRTLAVLLAAAVLTVPAACGGGGGDDAVSYHVTDMETGDDVSVDDLAGRPVLLVSWAT